MPYCSSWTLFASVMLCGVAAAVEPSPVPAVPPELAWAIADIGDDSITLDQCMSKEAYEQVFGTPAGQVGPGMAAAQDPSEAPVLVQRVRKIPCSWVQARQVSGKAISNAELLKALSKSTPVIVCVGDSRDPPPEFIQLFRDDAIILRIVRGPPVPPPNLPALPPPPPPRMQSPAGNWQPSKGPPVPPPSPPNRIGVP
jgi:hypothetical protein